MTAGEIIQTVLKWCITTNDFNTNDNINSGMPIYHQLLSIFFPKNPNDYVPVEVPGFERWLNNTSTYQKDEALAEMVSDVALSPWILYQLYVMFGMWHALLANRKADDA